MTLSAPVSILCGRESKTMSIQLSPDKEFVHEMRKKIKDNNGYCPCSLLKTPDTKCMCREFREMESGTCHCGLYIKINDGVK